MKMKISRLFKTIFMLDFIGGLLIAIKEIFKSKKNKKLAVITTQIKEKGKNIFHPNFIN